MIICRNCNTPQCHKARGLCWRCYLDADVREKFPLPGWRNAKARWNGSLGIGESNHTRPLPDQPTNAQPGTEEKIRVLEERAAAEVALWHPADRVEARMVY